MKPNNVVHLLLGAGVLVALPLLYMILLPPGQIALSPAHWLLFGALALPVVVAAISPLIVYRVRQARGLPPADVSAADLRFMVALLAVVCPLVCFAVWMFAAYGTLLILLVPAACIIRSRRSSQPST